MSLEIAGGTLTVNTAFLQEIKEVNEDLWRLQSRLRQLCSDPATIHHRPAVFIGLVEELRDQLALQFALEEAYGYFEDPVEVAPRLCELAYRLRAEHRQLYLQICALVERATGILEGQRSSDLVLEVVAGVIAFDDQFRRHESCEVAMIQEEYDDDIGVGD